MYKTTKASPPAILRKEKTNVNTVGQNKNTNTFAQNKIVKKNYGCNTNFGLLINVRKLADLVILNNKT